MTPPAKPYSRGEYATALAANAAAKPFNVAVLVGTMGGCVAVGGSVLVSLLLAVLFYAASCTRTFFDSDEADKVLGDERARRRKTLADPSKRLNTSALAPDIARKLLAARDSEARILTAIDSAELPYEEVAGEVERLLGAMEASAKRAQMLHEMLEESPVADIRRRHRTAQADSKPELAEALAVQLRVAERAEAQLARFHDEMERMVVELGTVRATLVSMSASTNAEDQKRIASEVRALREEMGSVSDGLAAAYET